MATATDLHADPVSAVVLLQTHPSREQQRRPRLDLVSGGPGRRFWCCRTCPRGPEPQVEKQNRPFWFWPPEGGRRTHPPPLGRKPVLGPGSPGGSNRSRWTRSGAAGPGPVPLGPELLRTASLCFCIKKNKSQTEVGVEVCSGSGSEVLSGPGRGDVIRSVSRASCPGLRLMLINANPC